MLVLRLTYMLNSPIHQNKSARKDFETYDRLLKEEVG
jgi:hypothetical protein